MHGSGFEENFLATTSDLEVIERVKAQLVLPVANRYLHINGKIAYGNEENLDWGWHFVQNQWTLEEISIEVCDGGPNYLQEHLDEWLGMLDQFCPWNSYVIKKMKN